MDGSQNGEPNDPSRDATERGRNVTEQDQETFDRLGSALTRVTRPIRGLVTPGRTATVGLVAVVGGQYLLYVDPGTSISYVTTLWVAVLLLTGGLLLGYGAGAA